VRLLLVDDNQDALRALSVLLELEGHEVTTSDNGRSAIRLMSEMHPQVAIIDVGMPEMDGFEVARTVRLNREFDDVVLVALTGYASESDKSRALAAGFDFHLTKPLSLDKLQYILANRADGTLRGLV
jgi:CheY-like chemotaxis protein